MRTIFYLAALCLTLLMFTPAKAQQITLDNITTMTNKGVGAIYKENTVIGYYMFYDAGKVGTFKSKYILKIYDQNLNLLMATANL